MKLTERQRDVIHSARIHVESGARLARRDGAKVLAAERQALADDLRALLDERDEGGGRISAYDHAAVGGSIERLR